jgi:hypothetical protein
MGYRDVSESLRAYRDRVAADLEAARQAAKEAADRAEKVSVLEKELAETDGLLEKVDGPRKLPMLENLAIAAPCTADWDQMVGDERVRFCRQCEKNVYNLSAMARDEAEALLAARESKMCVRLYKRADGTVLTSDCPVGVKRRRRRRAVAGVVGGGLMAAGAALAALGGQRTMGSAVPLTGAVAPVETATTVTTGAATEMGSAIPVMGAPPPVMGKVSPVANPQKPQKPWKSAKAPKPPALMGDVSMSE